MPTRSTEELMRRYFMHYEPNITNGVDMGTTWTNTQVNHTTSVTFDTYRWGATSKLKERVTKLGNKLD